MKEKLSLMLMIFFGTVLLLSNFVECTPNAQMVIGILLLGSFVAHERCLYEE